MQFSVIIPTCNRPELLRLCLDRLAPATQTLGEPFETIVTDDGTELVDGLIREHYPWARWVKGPRNGPASNRNNGAAHATGDWLVFTDDDCQPQVDWLERYRSAVAANPDAKAFEGAIHPRGDVNRDLAECPVNLEGDCFWSANICVRRDLFSDLKGFDQQFRIAAHEDQDIYIRIKPHTRVPFVRDGIVFHPVRYGTLWRSLTQLNERSLNWLYFARKHSKELQYHGGLGIVAAAYRMQIGAVHQAMTKGYPKQFLRALATLLYGVPLVASNLLLSKVNGR